MKYSAIKYIVLFLLAVSIYSCREDIIEPNNLGGNINEPLQIREFNSYTFIINAEQATFSFSDFAPFTTDRTVLVVTNFDYSSGSVKVDIINNNNEIYFTYLIAENLSEKTEEVIGFVPATIGFSLTNFTGKLKVQLFPF